jgi:flagellar protein FliS
MLYDGAINFLERALAGFDCSDPLLFNQTVNNNIVRAQAIIHEMNATLNMRDGGEVSANFRRLYNYLHVRLREANMKKKKEPVQEALMRLRVLRDSWAEMLRRGPLPPEDYRGDTEGGSSFQFAAA